MPQIPPSLLRDVVERWGLTERQARELLTYVARRLPPDLVTVREMSDRSGLSDSRIRDFTRGLTRYYGYWSQDIADIESEFGYKLK